MAERINRNMTMKDIFELPEFKDLVYFFSTNFDFKADRFYNVSLVENEQQESWCSSADSVVDGLNRYSRQLATGNCRFALYTEEEIAKDPCKKAAQLIWFPSDDPKAGERPYVMVVPGGGYVNVWELTEGYPIADAFNRLGFNAFVLSYQANIPGLFPRPLDDYARALSFIRDHKDIFSVQWDSYFTTGFSAGAGLISYWGCKNCGWKAYGMPKPIVMMPIYGGFSDWRNITPRSEASAKRLFNMTAAEVADSKWNVAEHLAEYPPCFIACCEDDKLVNPDNSRALKRRLDEEGIPAVLEVGKIGGHGFADGRNADTKGWIERAVAFMEQQKNCR